MPDMFFRFYGFPLLIRGYFEYEVITKLYEFILFEFLIHLVILLDYLYCYVSQNSSISVASLAPSRLIQSTNET